MSCVRVVDFGRAGAHCGLMTRNDLHVRVLRRTAASLGGDESLAAFLNVRVSDVEKWLQGLAPVPGVVFLACVDHLLPWQDEAQVTASRVKRKTARTAA